MYMLPFCLAAWQHVHAKVADINAPGYSYAVTGLFPAIAEVGSSEQCSLTLPDRSRLTKCNAEDTFSH